VVWPDPHFAAEQVTEIWSTDVPKEKVASAEAPPQPIERADKSALNISRLCPQRPDGISDRDWQTYLSALGKGYDLGIRGSITSAARAIAGDHGHTGHFTSERRALHRVLKKIN
jgi:hypothetical protein